MGIPCNFIVPRVGEKCYCMICDCELSGEKTVLGHLAGKRHAVSLQLHGRYIILRAHNNRYFCKCCGVNIFGSINVYPHLEGKRHTTLLNKSDEKLATTKGLPHNFVVRKSDNKYYCCICNCLMSGPIPATDHLGGFHHALAWQQYGHDIALIKNNYHYCCRLCKCQFLGYVHVWGHINGRRHRALMNEE